jgi:hypothetical protein
MSFELFKPLWRIALGLTLLALLLLGARALLRMPGRSHRGPLPPLTQAEEEIRTALRAHVEELAGNIGERNLYRYEALVEAADFIQRTFESQGHQVARQRYEVSGHQVDNLEVEAARSDGSADVVVIGAHYDSVFGCPGANDNATGAAALLEIGRLLRGRAYPRTLRLVAFVNEEPPFFLSDRMGSFRYAQRCAERGESISAMLSLETIGYYSTAPRSQRYPFPLGLFYPSTADFIGFVGNLGSRSLVRQVVSSFRSHTAFPSQGTAAPAWIPGVGWSDHWSFWRFGYPAVMVTETALYRYAHYHTSEDTPDKIDYERTARVVAGLARVVDELAGGSGLME